MSRHDSRKTHLIPSRSEEGRRIIRSGKVVNRPVRLAGVECLEITVEEAEGENSVKVDYFRSCN